MKVRIFSLAKELDVDSKVLIQHCLDAGLDVKVSPLASITEDERDVLMAHLSKVGVTGGGGAVASSASTAAPIDAATLTREQAEAERAAKMREIKTLGPLGGSMRSRRGPRTDAADAPSMAPVASIAPPVKPPGSTAPAAGSPAPTPSSPPPVVGAPEVVAEAAPKAPGVKESRPAGDATEVVANPVLVADGTPLPASPVVEGAPVAAPVTPQPVVGSTTSAPAAKGPSSIQRSDYVPPGGSGLSGIREMTARGNVREMGGADKKREKVAKRTPSLPSIALPTFKPVAPKPVKEEVAQKPEITIAGDLLKGSRLADLMRKKKEEIDVDVEEGLPKRGRSGSGITLDDMRERRKKRSKRSDSEDEQVIPMSRGGRRPKRRVVGNRKTEAALSFPSTIRDFCEAIGRTSKEVLGSLFRTGKMMTLNDFIEEELGMEVAMDLGVDLSVVEQETVEDALQGRLELSAADLGVAAVHRPPIVTILGHVDHGKTTLVDKLRSASVAAGEAGGITQHIAAYQVERDGKKVTFVDTPGHAAFGEMRARGANVTDIVVLVVAADDGVMPQTVECIAHAKAAGAPIIVALNKMDLPDINEQRILTGLSQHGVLPSEWGGDVEVVRVSALNGTGLDNLLETILLTAELEEFTAPEEVAADGVCLESFRDEGRGPLAWLIVRQGVLRIGDSVLCGQTYGRVRAMYNERDEELAEAGPSTPIKLAGLNEVPQAGDQFFVMDSIDEARVIAEERQATGRSAVLASRGGLRSLEDFFADRNGQVRELPLIVKADTPGSIEALRGELGKFEHPEVKVRILHEAVGGVNESDVYLAASSGAIIIAFHVVPEDRAVNLASQEGVEIRRYNIIYNVTDDIKQALEGLLKPERVEVPTGRALVLRTFAVSRMGTIAGCRVLNGTINRNNRVHVIRDQRILNDYPIGSLRREKDDVRDVRDGMECGIRLDGFNDVKEGDLLEAYRVEERKRTLDE